MKARVMPFVAIVISVAMLAPATAGATTGQEVHLNGVRTTLTTNPATTAVLVSHGILPLPVGPATVAPCWNSGKLSLRYGFPITGGEVNAATLAGYINHSGGLRFLNVANGRTLTLTNFEIRISADPGLSAEVNGNHSIRVRILNLNLTHAKVTEQPPAVTVSNVSATLTQTAATALNQALGVSFFSKGIVLGVAQVHAHIG